MLPRFVRLKDAPGYLGMDKNRFNEDVRPHVTEIPIGKAPERKSETRAIAFDRLDLDRWADHYKARYGRGPSNRKGEALWGDQTDSRASKPGAGNTGSISTTGGTGGFTKALAAARRTQTSGTSQRRTTRAA